MKYHRIMAILLAATILLVSIGFFLNPKTSPSLFVFCWSFAILFLLLIIIISIAEVFYSYYRITLSEERKFLEEFENQKQETETRKKDQGL